MYGIIAAILVTALVTEAGVDKRKPVHIDVSDLESRRYFYTMKRITVNKNTIKRINLMEPPFGHKRVIRSSQMNKIKQLLLLRDVEGNFIPQHFESPLVFEKTNGGYRTIDGNHRIGAMRAALDSLPRGSTISFFAAVYDLSSLDEDEKRKARREIFRKWNIGIKQSTHDFIEAYQDDIPMFKKIAGREDRTKTPLPERMIPCSVYGDVD